MVAPLLLSMFLLAHGAVHLGFVAPAPPATATGPSWPFATDASWLVTRLGINPDGIRDLAFALVTVIVAGFGVTAMVVLGLAPTSAWLPAVVVASTASIAMIAICFNPWLILGVAIDVGLLYMALVVGWVPTTALIV